MRYWVHIITSLLWVFDGLGKTITICISHEIVLICISHEIVLMYRADYFIICFSKFKIRHASSRHVKSGVTNMHVRLIYSFWREKKKGGEAYIIEGVDL